MKHFRIGLLCLAAFPLLTGCAEIFGYKAVSAGLYAASQGVFSRPDVNLTEKNYAAADYLAVQMKNKVGMSDDIFVMPLEEADNPGITSPFGAKVPEGVGLRLGQLGYKTWLSDVATEGNQGLYASLPQGMKPDFVLRGNYQVEREIVKVYLRILDAQNGSVVSYFDYQMPLSREIEKLAETPTRIYKVK